MKRLHSEVETAERILSGATLEAELLPVTNETVQERYTTWCRELKERLEGGNVGEMEQSCLKHFLHVTKNMAPKLFKCYDVMGLPRTNNDMEGFIRSVKTRYRRISGRKHWNTYLIRYGARVAYYEGRVRTNELERMTEAMRQVGAQPWRKGRVEQKARQQEQLKQHRVRHRRDAYLADLEARWAALEVRT